MLKHPFTSIYDMREFAKEKLGYPQDIEFFGWTEIFGSTAGPTGIGGQAMTPFDVIAFLDPIRHDAVMFCSNYWKIVRSIPPSERLRWQRR